MIFSLFLVLTLNPFFTLRTEESRFYSWSESPGLLVIFGQKTPIIGSISIDMTWCQYPGRLPKQPEKKNRNVLEEILVWFTEMIAFLKTTKKIIIFLTKDGWFEWLVGLRSSTLSFIIKCLCTDRPRSANIMYAYSSESSDKWDTDGYHQKIWEQ